MISVVIPTYHRNDLLARCLDRLAPGVQTFPADQYEVIVTDDGSSKNAESMIRDQYPWARWTQGPRRGPAANRNHGVRQAKSEWIAFTDDDCIPSTGWLAAFAGEINSGHDVYEGKTTCDAGIHSPMVEAPINLTGGHLWSCNMMVRSALFESINGFNETFPAPASEDVEFHSRLIRKNIIVQFVAHAVVDHPPRPRRIGLIALKQWQSRVLLESMLGSVRKEWLPIHVLKVRISQLITFPLSTAWIPYLSSTTAEVIGVTLNARRWKNEYRVKASPGKVESLPIASSDISAASDNRKLSVLVVTIDRRDEVERCIKSLSCIDDIVEQILILENMPSSPWSDAFRSGLASISKKITILQTSSRLTCAASRNYMATLATSPFLLILDDDAYLLDARAVRRGLNIVARDATVGAIAFAQCDKSGNLPVDFAQPAPIDEVCLTCGFAGYGNIIRRELYAALGGFQEIFEVAGEENEMCRRLWAGGHSVVWVPDRSVCHIPSDVNRDMARRAVLTARNGFVDSLLNDPWYLLPLTLPVRMIKSVQFFQYARSWHDRPILEMFVVTSRSVFAILAQTLRARRPLSLKYHLQWERIKRNHPIYQG